MFLYGIGFKNTNQKIYHRKKSKVLEYVIDETGIELVQNLSCYDGLQLIIKLREF